MNSWPCGCAEQQVVIVELGTVDMKIAKRLPLLLNFWQYFVFHSCLY